MKLTATLTLIVAVLGSSLCRADDKLHSRRYVLHPGDVLELHYRLSPEFDQTVTLEPDGHASLYVAGDLPLAGLTLDQARSRILQGVSSRLNDPELNLVLKDFERPYVVVGGEVLKPGKIEMREDLTALQALQLAGGPNTTARTNKIVLFRHLDGDMGEVKVLNLSNISKTKDLERDMRLEPGDMMFVTTSRTAKFERFMRAANFGLYLNPLSSF